ncbi:MAG: GAF domain-containing protein [Anaerolineae bacterium]|nr:GAF domain-containing protein [Anaerolineae bacterium]
MVRLRRWNQRTLYEKASWLAIALLLCATIAVELAAPILAWRWTRLPFLDLLFEHTLLVSGDHRSDWSTNITQEGFPYLVAVGDQPVTGDRDLAEVLRNLSPGQRVTLTLQRQDSSVPTFVETTAHQFRLRDWLTMFWLPYAVGLIYLAIGIWVFWLRGDHRPGQSFAIFCAFVALATGTLFDISSSHTLTRIWVASLPFTAAALVHLAFVFPEEGPVIRRWPLLRFVPYPIAAVLVAVSQLRLYTAGDPRAYLPTWRWNYVAMGVAVILFFILLLYSRSRTLSPIVRQQVRIILIGSALAFVPIAIFLALSGLGVRIPFQSTLYLPTLVIFPLSIAYAILRYRLLGMDLLVSRGLGYTILVAVSVGSYLLALTVLGRTLELGLVHGPSLLLAFVVLILLFALTPLRKGAEHLAERLLGWRRFDYRQALQTFSRDLATMPLDLPAILSRLLAQIEPVSHSAPALIFLYDSKIDQYTLQQGAGFAMMPDQEIRFEPDCGLARWLDSLDHPLYLLGDELRSVEHKLSAEERNELEALGLVLFLPLRGKRGDMQGRQRSPSGDSRLSRNAGGVGNDWLQGWIALGPRLSGEPYSPDNIAFLTALTNQTAIAVDNAQLLAGARHQAEELIALQETALDISAQRDLPVLLQAIIERAARLLGATGGGIYLVEDDGRQLRLVASHNLGGDYDGLVLPRGTGVAGQVALRAQPLRVNDYQRFAGKADAFAGAPFHAIMGVPLMGYDQVLGVLDVVDTNPTRIFSHEDEWLLALFAGQAAIALRNAQLFADLERRVVQLDALRQIGESVDLRRGLDDLLGQIYLQTERMMRVDNFYVALYDARRQEFTFAYYVEEGERREPALKTWPLGTGLTSEIVRQRSPIITDDYLTECQRRGVSASGTPGKAWLGAPLIAGDQVLGVLNVSSFQPDYRYTPEQVQVMLAIADQAAAAIERIGLYQEMKARAAELATLNEVSQTINSTLDLDNVLNLIMNKVVEILDVEAGSLLLLDEESGDLIFQVALGVPEQLEPSSPGGAGGSQVLIGRRHPLGSGIAGHVAQSGQAEIVNDAQSDPRWKRDVDKDTGLVTRSILCAPMMSRDRVIGVIEAINHRDGTPFQQSESDLLVAFAAQAAVAIENARLYTMTDQALAQRVDELSTMQRIDRELNAALDFDRVMDMTLDWALRGTGATVGVIGLHDASRQGLLLLASRGFPADYHRLEPWPLDRGIAGRVIRTGEPTLVDDVSLDADYYPALAATRSQLTVPIRREGSVVGVIDVESPKVGAFNDEHLAFIRRLADHAAFAIENARLYRETQQRLRELSVLFDTSAALSTTLNVDEVLHIIARQVTAILDAEGCAISSWDREQDALVTMLDYSRDQPDVDLRQRGEREVTPIVYPLVDYPASRRALESRQPISIQVSDLDVDPAEVRLMQEQGIRHLLMVPMIVHDEVVGMLELFQSREDQPFTPTDIGLVQTMANQAAAALENARLYEGVAEANQAKSEFIDFVAHELKQPMTSMQGYARMLTMGIGGELAPMQTQFVQVITSNVDRMGKLVNDLLEISRLEAGRTKLKLEPVQLREVIDETLINTRTEIDARHHTLEVAVPDDLPPVMGDRERLVQIMTNLVSNAYKYTPEGGIIRIAVDGRDQQEVPPGHLVISVSDTGIGMSPQEMAGLQEKFFRADQPLVRDQPGTGLGVSITRGLVALHGGELVVKSEAGKGTTFSFTVPTAA